MSQQISNLKWGEITVNGKTYKDIKIWPNMVKSWDWSETGTSHTPGIQVGDFLEFIDKVDYLVLSRGMDMRLGVSSDVIKYMTNKKIVLIMAETKQAVETYNLLARSGLKVGGLFHSTC